MLTLHVHALHVARPQDYIAPMFDTFVPLPEGDLRKQIEDLAASLSFPLTKLQVVIGSKRSSHSNAYFYGFGKNKRIVLFDTLLIPELRPVVEKDKEGQDGDEGADATDTTDTAAEGEKKDVGCTIDEVVAVLSHELGHWYGALPRAWRAGPCACRLPPAACRLPRASRRRVRAAPPCRAALPRRPA